ncbi:RagB/SusD family nutrient uptake outer membrane protein [Wenyingzhuangia sp. 2_MG-2023]|uniref:RagB/SusD family nutrient uptake outer membrane protein n=1 Tax=Wenyingzhuangia sp. 2_MG-2023 TaxID=3062639 RepID=UPI0026E15497|nr:RagB/SusD family nutrient uptake outer membrane protein [Wenyingzhuangia sp. 2_MG-2023]MDO6737183.1 RagB/SusD family nutrient uptake outer membrane protein [Wenyingzhuangia sp. 2_MG-2023]
MKKRFFYITILVSIFFFNGCSLEEEPLSEAAPDSIFSTPTGIRDGVNGIYSTLRNIYGTQEGFTVTTFGTDLFRHGKDGGAKFMDTYSNELNSTETYLYRIWTYLYAGINSANTILDRIDAVSELTEVQKNTYKAEARFLRAHYYYWLTLQFGDVVLRETETKGVNTEDLPTDKKVIWEFMKADTQFAIDNLTYTASDYGRATKGAALHQMARILILLEDYQGAETAAKEVINSGAYNLLDSYADVFDYNNQENSEIIFSVQYLNDALNNGNGNQGHLFFTPAYDQFPGLTRDVTQGGRPYTRFRPTEFFRNLFEENDTRFDVTFRYTWYYNKAETLPDGKSIGEVAIWETEPGVFSEIAPNTDKMHWGMKKHDDPTRASFQDKAGFRDFFVFRLSETYLLAAEALLMQDKKTEALVFLNTVRNRAAKAGMSLADIVAGDLDIDVILDERAMELGGEELRWMDLARTGKLVERVQKYNPNGAANIQDFHQLRPIPQTQIDLSTVDYPQNDKY